MVVNTLAFRDKEKSFMENGCKHSSFLWQGKKVLCKMVANTLAFCDKEKKFYVKWMQML